MKTTFIVAYAFILEEREADYSWLLIQIKLLYNRLLIADPQTLVAREEILKQYKMVKELRDGETLGACKGQLQRSMDLPCLRPLCTLALQPKYFPFEPEHVAVITRRGLLGEAGVAFNNSIRRELSGFEYAEADIAEAEQQRIGQQRLHRKNKLVARSGARGRARGGATRGGAARGGARGRARGGRGGTRGRGSQRSPNSDATASEPGGATASEDSFHSLLNDNNLFDLHEIMMDADAYPNRLTPHMDGGELNGIKDDVMGRG
ncbi:MAG: hypothetical protein L6R40_006768 [Gallowayella cf. fulva]|nr:MAG: hypothetical protein L6R40_006768 [Xanthomendoza cf. fulva]